MKEKGGELSQAEKAEAEAAINDGKKAIETRGLSQVQGALEKLTQVSHKISSALYEKTKKSGGGGDGGSGPNVSGAKTDGGGGKGKDDVIDADYKDVN